LDLRFARELLGHYARRSVLDTVFRLDDDALKASFGRRHGRGKLAAEPGPRKVRASVPRERKDDAERAVRAGLELIAAVSDLKTHAPLQTRVGIATGLVVVGDLIGSGRRPA
jgi:class 3 adenylate cyclase